MGKSYKRAVGSRAEVWHGTADHTSGGLHKKDLYKNKHGRIVSLKFENILKIDIDCSFNKDLSIEKVHDLTSEIEHLIRIEIKNSVITIHPEPN